MENELIYYKLSFYVLLNHKKVLKTVYFKNLVNLNSYVLWLVDHWDKFYDLNVSKFNFNDDLVLGDVKE